MSFCLNWDASSPLGIVLLKISLNCILMVPQGFKSGPLLFLLTKPRTISDQTLRFFLLFILLCHLNLDKIVLHCKIALAAQKYVRTKLFSHLQCLATNLRSTLHFIYKVQKPFHSKQSTNK